MNCVHSEFLRVEQTGKKERIQLTCTNRNSGEYGDWVTPADSCMQWKEEEGGARWMNGRRF